MDGPGPCSVMVGSSTCLHPAGLGESQLVPIVIFRVLHISHPQGHGELGPPTPAGWRQVPDPTMTEHGICPGPSICYIYSGIK